VLPEACEGCNNQFAQLADFNDQLFWQLETGQCGFVEVESFALSLWTKSGSTITSTGLGDYLVNYVRFDIVQQFIITVTVYDITGILNVGISMGGFEEITAPGTHEIHLTTSNNTSNTISILFGGGASPFVGSFSIDKIIPAPNGSLLAGLVDSQTLSVVEVLTPTITTNQQYLTAAINLADYDIEPGCYRLAIADYCENTCGQYFIYNPFFNSAPRLPIGWTSNPIIGVDNWTINGGSASITLLSVFPLPTGNSTELISITELCEGKLYYVTIVVDSISNARLTFDINGVQQGSSIVSAGTYSFAITSTETGFASLQATQVGLANGQVTVSMITVRADRDSATYDKYSDLIQIGDFSDDCRFFKIEGCNGENQFGFGFNGTSFLPGIRLEGRRFQPQYDTDTDLFRYASGRWQASFVDRKKKLSYYFGRLPEYVLDFLSIVFYFDNCYINGDTVFPADNEFPTIEYDNADDLGAITIDLYNKRDKVRKTVCVGVDADCLPSILDNDNEPFILTQDSERITTQDLINLYQE
jgi:hypothetical protein